MTKKRIKIEIHFLQCVISVTEQKIRDGKVPEATASKLIARHKMEIQEYEKMLNS